MNSQLTKPKLSIVIASINGQNYLAECLKALHCQTGNVTAEIIVVDCIGSVISDFITTHYPNIRLISFAQRQSVPELRAAGILAAQGEIIVITEDHCIPPSNWYKAIYNSHLKYHKPVIGGAVDNGANERIIDWAVFFCEYGNFLSPVPQGAVNDLPGPNVSYKRDTIFSLKEQFKTGFRETLIHSYLNSHGITLWSDPTIIMIHKKHFTVRDFCIERYHYSRAFAGKRSESISWNYRLFYLLLTLFLPPLLLTRICRRVLKRKQYLFLLLQSIPYLLLFVIIWAVGEFIGYVVGPGKSENYLA